jgi:hypothetical protein
MKCERACRYSFTTNTTLMIGVSGEMNEDIPVQTAPLHMSSCFDMAAHLLCQRLLHHQSCWQVPNGQALSEPGARVQF